MAGIRIDTSALSYPMFLIPGQTGFLDGSAGPTVDLAAGTYFFQQWSGPFTDLSFVVTPSGTVDYTVDKDGYLSGRGSDTLVVRGLEVRLDATRLSHDLLPTVAGAGVLGRDRVHLLRLVPSEGYGFQPGSGLVAEFWFRLTSDGQVVIEPQFAGFAAGGPGRVMIDGYRVAIDGRALAHDLLPASMLGGAPVLARDRLHDYTYIPAAGYGFQTASGVVADLAFQVTTDGQVVIAPGAADVAVGARRALLATGRLVEVDSRASGRGVRPSLLGEQPLLDPDASHELRLLPSGTPYSFDLEGGDGFTVDVAADGTVRPHGLPTGVQFAHRTRPGTVSRFCAVPDRTEGGLQPLAAGPIWSWWGKTQLRVVIDTQGLVFDDEGTGTTALEVIREAFRRWDAEVANLSFVFVGPELALFADIRVAAGPLAAPTIGLADYPPGGAFTLAITVEWKAGGLTAVTLHEIGHLLGLEHSSTPTSVMFPFTALNFKNQFVPTNVVLEPESVRAVNAIYGWEPQHRLGDRLTSDWVGLGVVTVSNDQRRVEVPQTIWKGGGEDPGIYYSEFRTDSWSPQQRMPDAGCSRSPALAQVPVPGSPHDTGLLAVWKGVGDDTQIYWSRNVDRWERPLPVPGARTEAAPGLARVNGIVFMAWPGEGSRLHLSRFDGTGGWSAPAPVDAREAIGNPFGTPFSIDPPALAADFDLFDKLDRLRMFWTAAPTGQVFHSTFDDQTGRWSRVQPVQYPVERDPPQMDPNGDPIFDMLPALAGGAPAASSHQGRLALTWRGRGEDHLYLSTAIRDSFSGPARLPDRGSWRAPAIAHFTRRERGEEPVTRIMMVWRGISDDESIYWSRM